MKIGRNQLCPCGSGKKYKKCHIDIHLEKPQSSSTSLTPIEQQHKAIFSYNRELRTVADKIMGREYPLAGDKELFTGFCLGKAYKTHGSVLLLCRQGYGQDAAILVRSLIDLLITLLYILNDPSNERISRYFSYDWILCKKMFEYAKTKPHLLKALEVNDVNPLPDKLTTKEIEEHARLAQEKYHYGRDWSIHNMRDMAKEVGEEDLYLTMYKLQSQLIHTAPRTMNEYIKKEDEGYKIEVGQNTRWVEEALVSAFDCFYMIIGQYDKLLELGFANQLDDVAKRYSSEVAKINSIP